MKVREIGEVILVLLLIGGIAAAVLIDSTAVYSLRGFFADNALSDTGSVNIVTSIYLGYRAFDTLGETVVLLLAVAGVGIIRERKR